MAELFKVGDLVWAKMKGFPTWPGRVIEPKPEVKRPSNKKILQFVFFFGSENYAWIPEDAICLYETNRDKFALSQRLPRGYKEAVEAIEDALLTRPAEVKPADLPSIEEELAQIFPTKKSTPMGKDAGRKKKNGKANTPSVAKESKVSNKDKKTTPKTPKPETVSTSKGNDNRSHKKTAKKAHHEESISESLDSLFGTPRQARTSNNNDDEKNSSEDINSLPNDNANGDPEASEPRPDSPEDIFGDNYGKTKNEPVSEVVSDGDLFDEEKPDLEKEIEAESLDNPGKNIQNESDSNLSPPALSSIKNAKESSSRGENIFEMFEQKKGSVMYEKSPEVCHEDEEDEKEDTLDDSMDYAVVTVDPDGQAHVLLENDVIENEVVLSQVEEIATEEVETEEFVEAEEVVEMDTNETETGKDTEKEASEEMVMESDKMESNHESDKESEDQVNLLPENEVLVGSVTDRAEIASKTPDTKNILVSEQAKTISETDKERTDIEIPELGEKKTEDSSNEKSGPSKPKKEKKGEDVEEGNKSDSTDTPTRRSTRTRIKKVDAAKEKAKPKPETIKPETPKPVAVRRNSGKRSAESPVSSSAKKGKLSNKAPSSPGHSAVSWISIPGPDEPPQSSMETPSFHAPSDQKPVSGIPADNVEPAVAGQAKPDVIPTPLKIGFLGLGIMGHGMVNNLLKSGHEVTVWNRTAQKCREFIKDGALKGNTPAEVVQSCDITFSCVSDPAAVKDLVFGNCGVLQGIQPGKSYVDMSTIDPDTVADVHEAVTSQGGRFLEAPVVGSRSPATTGDLVILAAGDRTLYEDCYSCFTAMGKKTFFLGETTSGSKMKLVVNMLLGTYVAGLAEALALADKVGLDQDALLQVLDLSVLSCPLVRTKGQAIMMSRFEPQFPLQHQQKDLRLCINMADSVDQPLHVATATNELFKKAKAKGYSQHDMCAVYRAADM